MREKAKRFGLFGVALLAVPCVAFAAAFWGPNTPPVLATGESEFSPPGAAAAQTPVRASGGSGVSALLPGRWRFAAEKLVPKLINPREAAALGTFEMPSGGGGECGMYPVKALAAMEADDALILLQEVGSGARPRGERLSRSRHRFPALRLTKVWRTSLGGGVWMRRFFDLRAAGDRAFYLTVAFGGKPSPSARAEVEEILASLRF